MSVGPIRLSQDAHTALRPPVMARITGGFWAAKRRVNAEVSVPQGPGRLEEAGNLANLRAAAGTAEEGFTGDFPFQDSDVHKWLEAASWQLAEEHGGPAAEKLAGHVARLAALVSDAQDADGYVQTYYQARPGARRWSELHWGHELYCAGHLLQAAVAHRRATGEDGLLDVAVRFADHIDAVFGPDKAVDAVCGHPEIETALVELYRETGERRYLDLAGYFVDRRGQGTLGDSGGTGPRPGAPYWQDHIPVRDARAVAGHAVRQLYLLAGAADLAAETGDRELRDALVRLWEDMVATKTYLTGGVGSRHDLESFGDAYELPPDRAYAETCAAIASIQFSWRMALLTGDARYSDLIERILFNGFASGVSLDGERWLYVNPLQVRDGRTEGRTESHGDQEARRTPWFRCACCPPNVMRLLASLPHYMASGDAGGLQLHQYASGVYAAGGGTVRVGTGYPWEGRIAVVVDEAPAEADWTLSLRIPHWADRYEATVGGEAATERAERGWLRLRRRWRPGETVVLTLPLAPRLTRPDPRVDAVRGCAAIEHGPLVYCLEQPDQPAGLRLDGITLDTGTELVAEHRPRLLGGVTVIMARALRRAAPDGGWWPYPGAGGDIGGVGDPVRVTAIPYYAWANREAGPMRVWIPS
ncbi:putative cytoplasmic protein [Streptomyces himastatinicus ATCC 53653]|uniref:Putative cytoplasmic protein n=1 Tax=Streptomyces himastatinicus ATCC 53653 TaxID=457427 RepID=D9WFM3_9ACTN|nr:beta-L-arabinofuranosidase domain-containing protein [Streptomyces himastatinicus]EFL28981.1 putative cytoplasmic protein [Streptomyces himastatinicus ATCC 53653]